MQPLIEARYGCTECVGRMQKPAEDARHLGTLSRCSGRSDGVEDAHVTARVDGGETPLDT
jgi:hypothetical protein